MGAKDNGLSDVEKWNSVCSGLHSYQRPSECRYGTRQAKVQVQAPPELHISANEGPWSSLDAVLFDFDRSSQIETVPSLQLP